MDSLFDPGEGQAPPGVPADAPLAARMRPQALDEVVGQEHLLGDGSALRTAVESGQPHSMILFGPPGTGKTTLARLVARTADHAFEELSAVQAGKAEVVQVMKRAEERRRGGRGTVLFLDEIHRFNKAQQDALLPAVEEGLLVLVGATTENPYFEVNSALISRSRVYELRSLTAEQVAVLLRRAIDGGECGEARVADEAVEFLAARAGGDARTALNALELACESRGLRPLATPGESGPGGREVGLAEAEDALQRRAVLYDRAGDKHYDYISAWIKSTRGSDPDASLYYLAVMLEGGEDARFIARRMIVLASEDIGNADPNALTVAVAAAQAVEHVGLPEAQFSLSQAAIYLSMAPKSDAAKRAILDARAHVRDHGAADPPAPLRSAAYPASKALGRGVGYENPHRTPSHVNDQEHLPAGREDLRFYDPGAPEKDLRERLERIRRARGRDG
jgi:putative ATPase